MAEDVWCMYESAHGCYLKCVLNYISENKNDADLVSDVGYVQESIFSELES